MKRILAFALFVLFGLSFGWYNPATPDILDARYDYVECDVEFAEDFLSMREDCGEEENVSVFDSSEYVEDLDDGLADLREAADEGDTLEFGIASLDIGLNAGRLLIAIAADAFDHKTLAFFSCVRDDEVPLKEERDECREDALAKEKDASKDYVNNELDNANDKIDELDALGADTSGMEEIIDYGEELVDDIDPAFDSGDIKEVRKLHLRHSRLVLLFRLEAMLSTIDYATPIIEDSDNDNKEEILERTADLSDDTEALIDECEYSDEVDDNLDYGIDNLHCWEDALDLYKEFNSIRWLILEGAV